MTRRSRTGSSRWASPATRPSPSSSRAASSRSRWYPDQRRELVADPTLLKGAVEEMLRWEPPSHLQGRTAARDVELHGVTIPAGDRVMLITGSATHDERVYDEPELFDAPPRRPAPGHVRVRDPRLPGRAPGPARDPDRVRGAARPFPRLRHRRHPRRPARPDERPGPEQPAARRRHRGVGAARHRVARTPSGPSARSCAASASCSRPGRCRRRCSRGVAEQLGGAAALWKPNRGNRAGTNGRSLGAADRERSRAYHDELGPLRGAANPIAPPAALRGRHATRRRARGRRARDAGSAPRGPTRHRARRLARRAVRRGARGRAA